MSSGLVARVTLPRAVLDQVLDHASREAPRECCGLLVGRGARIDRAVPTRNAADSPTRYLIHPQDHFAAVKDARARGDEIVGAYHSHPSSPPVPSPTDVREANDGRLVHLIVSPAAAGEGAGWRAYRLDDGGYVEIGLDVVP